MSVMGSAMLKMVPKRTTKMSTYHLSPFSAITSNFPTQLLTAQNNKDRPVSLTRVYDAWESFDLCDP